VLFVTSPVVFRRALHRIPELDSELPETVCYVENALAGLPCHVFSLIHGSVCAFFDAGKRDSIVFRADMDALPITEETGLPFSSEHAGIMHACGHDGHTAIALSLAEYAASHLDTLPWNVLFLFQPSEETTGGARQLCETGIFEKYRVRRVFGLHLWPGLPAGTVWSRPGPMMARSSEVSVIITGKSAHIAHYREGCDALSAGCEYLRRAYSMIEQLPSDVPTLLRFGKMTSGTVRNAISGHTELLGSLRAYSESTFSFCRQRLAEIGASLAEETGCGIDVQISEGYPAVWNHEELYREICGKLGPDVPGILSEPALETEDFSFYQQCAPGVFFFLGAGDVPALHSPRFTFDDEAVLPRGLSFLEKLLMME
jgi:hippurate hydrolase